MKLCQELGKFAVALCIIHAGKSYIFLYPCVEYRTDKFSISSNSQN